MSNTTLEQYIASRNAEKNLTTLQSQVSAANIAAVMALDALNAKIDTGATTEECAAEYAAYVQALSDYEVLNASAEEEKRTASSGREQFVQLVSVEAKEVATQVSQELPKEELMADISVRLNAALEAHAAAIAPKVVEEPVVEPPVEEVVVDKGVVDEGVLVEEVP